MTGCPVKEMKAFNICCIDPQTKAEVVLSECPSLGTALCWLLAKTGKNNMAKLYKNDIHKITVEGVENIIFLYDAARMYLLKGDPREWR